MSFLRRIYPFNLEQTINLLSEFGPLITLFVVNAIFGVTAGVWSLIGTTLLALVAMRVFLNKLPILALIAGGFTLIFSSVSLLTHDPVWVQIKVTLFNAAFAAFLGFGLVTRKNFFKYAFESTFHYTQEGWNRFTLGMMILFLVLAVANEGIRLAFWHANSYELFGHQTTGLQIWILFKVAVVMPGSGLYAFLLTRPMRKYAIPPEDVAAAKTTETAVEVSMIP
ncbi:MAG: septation protein IspZ [Verrucomicrobia bacterium]|nr:septation protein IspZ [Verrucomicrobiota bacterium]